MTARLSDLSQVAPGVRLPAYVPAAHGVGIVHLGLGAFHRAHQAAATCDALSASGGDWRIWAASLRSAAAAEALGPQNGLYTLLERGEALSARVIGALAGAAGGDGAAAEALARMAAPGTRIVTLTITEKGYGLSRAAGGCDPAHPAVAADLADPRSPTGALGLVVEAQRLRRAAGLPFLTVLCCDNLPDNGKLLKGALVDFAMRAGDGALAEAMRAEMACPSCMVDRITPPATGATLADAERLTGCADLGAIETEPFFQWVIEDDFPTGRPDWEAGGAQFVEDVAPYEAMKLRMLNGAHSMMAYVGALSHVEYVRDVMADPALALLVRRHMAAAAATLPPMPGADLPAYAEALAARFANPAIAHATRHIAMDGTEKLPQRILAPAVDALEAGQPLRPFAFAAAAWMRWAMGVCDDGRDHPLNDPREAEIKAALRGVQGAAGIRDALAGLPGLFPDALRGSPEWAAEVECALALMLSRGMKAAAEAEADAAAREAA
ncbi:mannitol dehydrogenase family protein [Rhodovulum sp. DZ06]|uniref:mannitol dehydrogenase family protein n=1 Tax=Rhodovulum sp. DZ06 TaxID=3425126 RepID=UPI003D3475D0